MAQMLKVTAARPMWRAGRKWPQGVTVAPIEGKVKPKAFEGDKNFTVEVVDAPPAEKKAEKKTEK